MSVVRATAGDTLDAPTLHDLLALRAAVFVVEQRCPYLDVDGQDLLPTTTHLWIVEHGEIVAAARVLDGDPPRIGRVVTTPAARGRGLGALLVSQALAHAGGRATLHAQSHLVDWYRAHGFEVCGAEYLDDGVPHTPMAATGAAP